MLGKLYKHEFKSTFIQLSPILIAVVIASLVNRFVMSYEYNSGQTRIGSEMFVFRIFQVLAVITITAFIMITFVLLIRRFAKTMVEDQGYLTLTLPVKSWEHILVKSSVSSFWIILSCIITVFSFVMMIPGKGFLSEFSVTISEGLTDMAAELNIGTGLLVTELVFYVIISSLAFFFTIYAAIAIGQMWNGHTKLGTFLTLVGFYIVNSVFSNLITDIFANISAPNSEINTYAFNRISSEHVNWFFLIYLAYMTIAGIFMFLASSYIFEKKINLQ